MLYGTSLACKKSFLLASEECARKRKQFRLSPSACVQVSRLCGLVELLPLFLRQPYAEEVRSHLTFRLLRSASHARPKQCGTVARTKMVISKPASDNGLQVYDVRANDTNSLAGWHAGQARRTDSVGARCPRQGLAPGLAVNAHNLSVRFADEME